MTHTLCTYDLSSIQTIYAIADMLKGYYWPWPKNLEHMARLCRQ